MSDTTNEVQPQARPVDGACPRCGRGGAVEELGVASGSTWLHCDHCGHLWRRLDPQADAFSLILGSRIARARLIAETACEGRVPRAARFQVHLAMKYRSRQDPEWRTAVTENISRSGVLFRADGTLDSQTPIEVILQLPGAVAGEPPSRLRSEGRVVRTSTCHAPDLQPCVAAAVAAFQLTAV